MKKLGKILKNKLIIKLLLLIAVFASIVAVRCTTLKGESYTDTKLRVIVYNGIGESDEFVSFSQLEDDLRYLTNSGYSPVFISEVVNCLEFGCDLPVKPIVLTFDNSQSCYADKLVRVLKKYRAKAVISVPGKQTELASNSADDNNSYLRWEDISQLRKSGLAEITNASFSYWNSKDFGQKKGESYSDYRCRIIADIGRQQSLFEENCGFEPEVFTYPDGRVNSAAARFVKDLGFIAGLYRSDEEVIIEGSGRTDPYRIPCILRDRSTALSDILK